MGKKSIGGIAALVGFAVVVLLTILASTGVLDVSSYQAWITGLLVVLGVIVGFMNISRAESTAYLAASIVLILGTGALVALPGVGSFLDSLFDNLALFVIPGAVVVAVSTIVKTSR